MKSHQMVSMIATDPHAVYQGKFEGILMFWQTAVITLQLIFDWSLKAKLTQLTELTFRVINHSSQANVNYNLSQ